MMKILKEVVYWFRKLWLYPALCAALAVLKIVWWTSLSWIVVTAPVWIVLVFMYWAFVITMISTYINHKKGFDSPPVPLLKKERGEAGAG